MKAFLLNIFLLFAITTNFALSTCVENYSLSHIKIESEEFKSNDLLSYEYSYTSTCDVLNFGFYKGDVLLRLNKTNKLDNKDFVVLDNPMIDKIEVYKRVGNNLVLYFKTGDHYIYGERRFKNFWIPIEGENEIFIRISNYGNPLFLPLYFTNKENILDSSSKNNLSFGLLFGLMLLAFLFNSFLWIKKSSSIYYSLFLLALFLLFYTIEGYAFQFIWPNSIYIQNYAHPIITLLLCFSVTKFFQFFFNTKKHVPVSHTWLNRLIKTLPVISVFCLIPNENLEQSQAIVSNLCSLVFIGASIPAFIKLLKILEIDQWIMTAALAIFLTLSVLYILGNFTLLHFNQITLNLVEIGATIFIILSIIAISYRFKNIRDFKIEQLVASNRFKQQENLKLEQKIKQRKEVIRKQSDKILEQNSKILKSITYSNNIQQALLPSKESLKEIFTHNFIIYKPKDIVSGDFYWTKKINIVRSGIKSKYTLFAVGDCTGHGLPGALISVLAINTLNLAVRLPENKSTEDILNFLNHDINSVFNTNIEIETIRDGLDISICALDHDTNVLYYSTAKSQILHIENGKLSRLKTSSTPIGNEGSENKFNQDKIQLQKGSRIYLMSDGFADQFGGPYGKKLKSSNLKKKLLETSTLAMEDQRDALIQKLQNWKGNLEQTDDITILGFEV